MQAATDDFRKKQEELERKAAELDRREQELNRNLQFGGGTKYLVFTLDWRIEERN